MAGAGGGHDGGAGNPTPGGGAPPPPPPPLHSRANVPVLEHFPRHTPPSPPPVGAPLAWGGVPTRGQILEAPWGSVPLGARRAGAHRVV